MRILLSAAYSIIEPLGLIYLAGLAKKLGHTSRIVLVKDFDFRPLFETIRQFKPDLVGFNVYTGAHRQVYPVITTINRLGIRTIIGGPHATYFAEDAARVARHVVRGEGFTMFRQILEGRAPEGVLFDGKLLREGFPFPDRATFYNDHPRHRDNPIKNSITALGCPYACTYCYNVQYNDMYGGFKLVLRPVEDVVAELEEVRKRWPTRMIYFQDDVFGFNVPWLEKFAELYRARVNIPWHAQIRLELTRDPRRLKLFKEGGCCGITTAVESADPWMRTHILDRDGMTNEEIKEGCRKIQKAGLPLRTEQILMVPGNDLALDLETLRLNVEIGPVMAWSSIFAPYRGVALGERAVQWGYYAGDNTDLTETYFDRSVLRFYHNDRYQPDPTKPNPLRRPFTEAENEAYRSKGAVLQSIFTFFTYVPHGDRLAARWLEEGNASLAVLGDMTLEHLGTLGCSPERFASRTEICRATEGVTGGDATLLEHLWPYFTLLPHGWKLVERFFGQPDRNLRQLGMLTRHHLYDEVLYNPDPLPEPAFAPVA